MATATQTSTKGAAKATKGAKGAQVQAPKGATVQSPFAAAAAQLAARNSAPAPAPAAPAAPVKAPHVGAAGNSGAVNAAYAPGTVGAQIWAAAHAAAAHNKVAVAAVSAPMLTAYMVATKGLNMVYGGAVVPCVTKNGAVVPLNTTSLSCGLTHLRGKLRTVAAVAAKAAQQGA